MTVKGLVVDPVTGELITEISEGDKIIRDKSIEYLKGTIEILKGEPHVKIFVGKLKELHDLIEPQEAKMIHYMLSYLSYESGILINQNGRFVTREQIAKELDMSERQVDRTIEKLKEHEVLKKVLGAKREVSFVLNPWLFVRGTRINRTLYEMFKNSRWAKVVKMSEK